MQDIKLYDHFNSVEKVFEKIYHVFEIKIDSKLQIKYIPQFHEGIYKNHKVNILYE